MRHLIQVACGQYTPFLHPFWTARDYEILSRSISNPHDPEWPESLMGRLNDLEKCSSSIFLFGSGRMAIQAVLTALCLPVDARVGIASFSCRGVVDPVIRAGMTPVFLDIDNDLNLNLPSLKEVVDENPLDVIIAPHLGGVWSNHIEEIEQFCLRNQIILIEDCAHRLIADSEGLSRSRYGVATIFSSGLGKPAFGPGGGWASVRDPKLVDRMSELSIEVEKPEQSAGRLRSFQRRFPASIFRRGAKQASSSVLSKMMQTRKPSQEVAGLTSMTAVDAELLLRQLDSLEENLNKRRENAHFWVDLLRSNRLEAVRTAPLNDNSFQKFWLDFSEVGGSAVMQDFVLHLWHCGVETETLYRPLHELPEFRHLRCSNMCNTSRLASSVISVPVRPNLERPDFKRIESSIATWKPRLKSGQYV